jgi:hypothetical protein
VIAQPVRKRVPVEEPFRDLARGQLR